MAATLHKLTAGDGYLYLIRQVAAADSTVPTSTGFPEACTTAVAARKDVSARSTSPRTSSAGCSSTPVT